jgi:hypothetical protein
VSRRLLILDDSVAVDALPAEALRGYDDVALAFWASPELERRIGECSGGRVHSLPAVVGGLTRWERRACELVDRVCLAGPTYHGTPWRGVLAEPMFRECLLVQLALDLAAFCRERSTARAEPLAAIELRTADRLGGLLAAAFAGTPLAPLVRHLPDPAAAGGRSLHRRLARRFRHARLTGHWWAQAWNLANELDRAYAWRARPGRRTAPPWIAPGGTTIFSSYLNSSRILAAVEPWAAAPVSWVVTNLYAQPPAGSAAAHWLWRWSRAGEPLDAAGIEDSPSLAPGGSPEERRLLTACLPTTPTWRYWRQTGRLALPRLTRCWEGYLERAHPARVAMASLWGLEGWLAGIARRRGVPVVQLLHGVLGGAFHTGRPIDADALVVWGEFWRRRWPEGERRKIVVANPGGVAPAVERRPREPGQPPRLTYFSWPLDRVDYYSAPDLLDGFVDLFHRLTAQGACTLTLRAHPLENPSDLVAHWRRRHGALPAGLRISQREPLASVLADTDVALLYRSTVLLDGFASGIPMLLPGWLDFAWSGELNGVEGVHRARDFADLEATLLAWLAHPPRPAPEAGAEFLAPEGTGVDRVAALLGSGPPAAAASTTARAAAGAG